MEVNLRMKNRCWNANIWLFASYYHAILASWWTILGQFSGLDTSSSPQPPDWTIYPKKSNFNPLAGIFAHFWRDSFFSQPFCGEHFVYCQPPDWDIWYNLTFTTFLGWTQEQRLHFSGLWVWCPPLKKHAHWNASINIYYNYLYIEGNKSLLICDGKSLYQILAELISSCRSEVHFGDCEVYCACATIATGSVL